MAEAEYDPGREATVTLVLTRGEAQDVFDAFYKYDTTDGWLTRSNVAQALLKSGSVRTP